MLHPTMCVMQDNVQVVRDLLSKIDHLMTAICNNSEDAKSVLQHLSQMKSDLGTLQEGYEVRCASQAWVHARMCSYAYCLHHWRTGFQP